MPPGAALAATPKEKRTHRDRDEGPARWVEEAERKENFDRHEHQQQVDETEHTRGGTFSAGYAMSPIWFAYTTE